MEIKSDAKTVSGETPTVNFCDRSGKIRKDQSQQVANRSTCSNHSDRMQILVLTFSPGTPAYPGGPGGPAGQGLQGGMLGSTQAGGGRPGTPGAPGTPCLPGLPAFPGLPAGPAVPAIQQP